ncbi:Zinc finger, CCHC-type [Sesbania bispinosa]|nr:Zinc finger, CCHC-type [Sesbania bispinosa]
MSSAKVCNAAGECNAAAPTAADGSELSAQEKDLLNRSTKKPKVSTLDDASTRAVNGQEKPQANVVNGGSLFQTTIGLGMERKMVSYKDICIGVNGHNVSEEDVVFFEEIQGMHNDVQQRVDEHDQGFLGDPLCSEVRLSDEERRMISIPWKRSIIVKVLGRKMTLRYFHARLYKLWKPKFRMKIIDLDNEYFVIREKAGADGEFETERAKFARICIEIDLNKILISQFSLEKRIYNVEYEGLHLVCFQCGRYGHKKEGCPLLLRNDDVQPVNPLVDTVVPQPAAAPMTETSFGPWMLVQKSQRRNSQNISVDKGGKQGAINGDSGGSKKDNTMAMHLSGSRFNALHNDEDDEVGANVAHDSERISNHNQEDQTPQDNRRNDKSNADFGPTKANRNRPTGASGSRKAAKSVSNHARSSDLNDSKIQEMIINSDKDHLSKVGVFLLEAGSSRCSMVSSKCLGSKSVGPVLNNLRRVGLNLKSQVRLKNVKTAARNNGALPILSLPLMNESVNILSSKAQFDDTSLVGQKDDVEICNS